MPGLLRAGPVTVSQNQERPAVCARPAGNGGRTGGPGQHAPDDSALASFSRPRSSGWQAGHVQVVMPGHVQVTVALLDSEPE